MRWLFLPLHLPPASPLHLVQCPYLGTFRLPTGSNIWHLASAQCLYLNCIKLEFDTEYLSAYSVFLNQFCCFILFVLVNIYNRMHVEKVWEKYLFFTLLLMILFLTLGFYVFCLWGERFVCRPKDHPWARIRFSEWAIRVNPNFHLIQMVQQLVSFHKKDISGVQRALVERPRIPSLRMLKLQFWKDIQEPCQHLLWMVLYC